MENSDKGKERYRSLIAEYGAIDKVKDPERAANILLEAGSLLDQQLEPKKWASCRSMYARFIENTDPQAAISAYREALDVWDPVQDRDSWAACHSGIGTLMVNQQPFGPIELDEAILHLEHALNDQPFLAALLAVLYNFRTTGDPWENWKKRISYLRQHLEQISREDDPDKWAKANNELGVAVEEEPDADYAMVLEERIRCHQASLAALDRLHNDTWIETCIFLSECFLFRVGFELKQNHALAEQYARQAMEACNAELPGPIRAKALLALAKALMAPGIGLQPEALHEGLALCSRAAELLDSTSTPALMASVESIRANILLKLMLMGETEHKEMLALHAETALRLLQSPEHIFDRRSILQVAGDGMLAAGDYENAAGYLRRALDAVAAALDGAGTRAGRMQRIWEFRDSSALLSWCLLKLGRTEEAIVELERGKAHFWITDAKGCAFGEIKTLVPANGALLFANFACNEGCVVVLTAEKMEVVWLPAFGKNRLMELQRGGVDAAELGGWLKTYHMRNTEPLAWRHAIDAVGEILYRELWTPVLGVLNRLGIAPDAELVWFPQGGSGVFPVHSAWGADDKNKRHWLLDAYTVRYAPSARALHGGENPLAQNGPALLATDPHGDLQFSALESLWIQRILSGRALNVLHGIEATPEAVLEGIAGSDILHFSTHAVFDLNRPFQSYLLLAGGEKLTIERLLPALEKNAPSLVALSACETGMTRVSSTPDEFLGFPAAFLYAGTRTVLSALWPVDDAATAVLSGRFYYEWIERKQKPSRALREAQNWIRQVTVNELMELLRGLKNEPPPVGPLAARIRTALRALDASACPFAEPYFWAAFTISGKE